MYGQHYIDHVPEVEPVSSDYYIACHYFPGWPVGKDGSSGFTRLTDFPDRTPLIGYYDEALPEVADWEVKWAREHGINCFIYCWYRRQENVGLPVSREGLFYAHQLEALKNSRYGSMMDFAIMWECDNAGVAADEHDLLDNLLPFWVEEYFSRPTYLKIDNKPVLYVYDYSFRMVNGLGGPDKTRIALEKANEKIREYGFDGIIFQAEYRYDDPRVLAMFKQAGFQAVFAYCWHTLQQFPTQEEVLERQHQLMKSHLDFDPSFTILTCSKEWDPYAWNRDPSTTRWCLTPNNWRRLLEDVKAMADSMPEGAPGRRFIMMDNWNEWGEGHYLAPHVAGGFKYLQAIREVFTKRDNLPDYRLPQQLGLGPYDKEIVF